MKKNRGAYFIILSFALILFLVVGRYYLKAENNQQTSKIGQLPAVKPFQEKSGKILLEGTNYEYFSVYNFSTGEIELLIPPKLSPHWGHEGNEFSMSPNKKFIGVITNQNLAISRNPDLYVYSLANHTKKILASNLNPPPSDIHLSNGMKGKSSLAWSPDSRKIVFLSAATRKPELWTVNIDGTDLKQITNDGSFKISLLWSPDGSKILYRSISDTTTNTTSTICLYDTDTGINTTLDTSSNTILQELLRYKPVDFEAVQKWINSDTLLIVSSSQKRNLRGIWLLTVSTMKIKRVINKPIRSLLSGKEPISISPDGKKILFMTMKKTKQGITIYDYWLANTGGSRVIKLTKKTNYRQIGSISWSGDSNAFAYDGFQEKANTRKEEELWIYNLSSKKSHRILVLYDMEYSFLSHPIWSPDSNSLLFQEFVVLGAGTPYPEVAQEETDRIGVWLINTDGTGLQKITDLSDSEKNFFPHPVFWY